LSLTKAINDVALPNRYLNRDAIDAMVDILVAKWRFS
jgi:hypothetical protein